MFVLLPVNFFSKATTPVAHAAVPHALVKPAPRSQTLTNIFVESFICAKVTFIF